MLECKATAEPTIAQVSASETARQRKPQLASIVEPERYELKPESYTPRALNYSKEEI